jgi:hypothetical protein
MSFDSDFNPSERVCEVCGMDLSRQCCTRKGNKYYCFGHDPERQRSKSIDLPDEDEGYIRVADLKHLIAGFSNGEMVTLSYDWHPGEIPSNFKLTVKER